MSGALHRRSSQQPIKLITRDDPKQGSIGELAGYISVFNSDSVDLGGYLEQIAPGAFTDSLQKNDVVALVNHDSSVVVGRMSAGTLRLNEDDIGLAFSLDLPDTQAGRDLQTLVGRGDLLGCSFGFMIDEEIWTQRDGQDFCILQKVDLFEVSVGVTFPAYESTSMELRDRLTSYRERERARDRARFEFVKLRIHK